MYFSPKLTFTSSVSGKMEVEKRIVRNIHIRELTNTVKKKCEAKIF
jgi:hypothetical protein